MKVPILIPVEKSGTGNYGDTPDVEITILDWLSAQGDMIKKGEIVVRVNENKVEVEISSTASGKLVEILTPQDSQFTLTSEVIEVFEDGSAFYKKVLGYIETIGQDEAPKTANIATPVAIRIMENRGIDPALITERDEHGKIGKEQVEKYLSRQVPAEHAPDPTPVATPTTPASEVKATSSTDSTPSINSPQSNSGQARQASSPQAGSGQAPSTQLPSTSLPSTSLPSTSLPSTSLRASPAARALARERGIDLATAGIVGTGPDGMILPADIPSELPRSPIAVSSPVTQCVVPVTQNTGESGAEESIVLSPAQQAVARSLEKGWHTPTAMDSKEFDLSILLYFRGLYANKFEEKIGVRLQLAFPFVAAIVRVLARDDFRRILNGYIHLNEKTGNYEFVPSKNVNLGIAFNTPKNNLVILTVHGAQKLSLRDLAHATVALQKKSQDGTFTLRDTQGFSFIFNNLGGLKTLIRPAYRKRVRKIRGYSLLPENMALQIDLSDLGDDGWAEIPIIFDHRATNGGSTTILMDEVIAELYEHVIPELQELCEKA